ncbi:MULTISPECIES: hypothetical protein [Pseudomonas]|uniref:hypothetical protein n=1 Tax=Pseudomonas TaxID=286 RepID=UPI000D00A702|nr:MULTISPECIES: hypothetical protein [Pseudomonas]PRA59125.1 hypothetical protein CQZ98_04645 [Pseudomonas sp. MYb115]QXN49011.1 hypothetical protein KW062_22455 [Pseudomonas fluorescens]WSO23322.1 hypothetical protein VUJ50_22610 [Pseudomonas fluorescens]
MTDLIACPATSLLTEDDLTTLSLVFPPPSRPQLIELRCVLNKRNASFRTYESGIVTFDKNTMLREVALKCSAKTAERVTHLVAQGVCLQAIASVPLRIPLTGTEPISLRL